MNYCIDSIWDVITFNWDWDFSNWSSCVLLLCISVSCASSLFLRSTTCLHASPSYYSADYFASVTSRRFWVSRYFSAVSFVIFYYWLATVSQFYLFDAWISFSFRSISPCSSSYFLHDSFKLSQSSLIMLHCLTSSCTLAIAWVSSAIYWSASDCCG